LDDSRRGVKIRIGNFNREAREGTRRRIGLHTSESATIRAIRGKIRGRIGFLDQGHPELETRNPEL
jgi:hypothetical protein